MALRSHTLVEDYSYICLLDDAVDAPALPPDADEAATKLWGEQMAAFQEKWRLYLDGAGEPPLKPGVEPARFTLRNLSNVERTYLLELQQLGEKGVAISATSIALVAVKGYTGRDGKPIVVTHDVSTYGLHRIRHASEATINAMDIGAVMDIGHSVLQRMRLRPS